MERLGEEWSEVWRAEGRSNRKVIGYLKNDERRKDEMKGRDQR